MPSDSAELHRVLERSRRRIVHVFAAAAIVHLAVAAVVVANASSGRASEVAWCAAAGAMLGGAGWLWYRARVRAIAHLIAAVGGGASLYRCEMTHWWISHVIPIGYRVDMVAVDAANARDYLAFGFWRQRDAEQLLALVGAHMVAGPLPPIEVALWRPAGRGDGLPPAKARAKRS